MLAFRTRVVPGHERGWAQLAERRPRSGPRRVLIGLLGGVALLGAAVVGWLVGGWMGTAGTPARSPATRVTEVGPLRVALEGSWSSARAPARSPYAVLADASVFAPVAGAPAAVLLGRFDARHRSLVPSTIRAALSAPLPAPANVRIAGRPAWAYRGLQQRDGRILDLFVAPMESGNLIVACTALRSWWTVASGCERGLRSIAGSASVHPSPTLAARHVLPAALAKLNRDRRAGAAGLRRARTRPGQAAALRHLAHAHEVARRTVAPVLAPSSAVTASLAHAAKAYGALARAAARGPRWRYRRARIAANRASGHLRLALAKVV